MRKILLISVLVCFVFSAFADDPVYITDGSKCTNATTGATGGNISLRTVYQPKSIPITWESNGTTYTTSTCTYDTQLQMPVAPTRLGYTFDGWTLEEACEIPSSLATTNGSSYGYKNDSTGEWGEYSYNTGDYGLIGDNTWGVTWSNGDKVTGVALCSAHSGDNHSWQWGGNSSDWTSDETTLTSASGETQYCWCKATHYTANNAQQCSLSSPAWVFSNDVGSAADCAGYCAIYCADDVRHRSGFRVALFGGNVVQ